MRGKSWGPDAMPRSASPKRKVPAQKEKTSAGTLDNPIDVEVSDVAMATKDSGKDGDSSTETEEITSRTQQIVLTDKDGVGIVKEAWTQPAEPKKLVNT